jgi:hypothetical protein
MYCAINVCISYCLEHRKGHRISHFLKMTFMPALRGETAASFGQVSQFRKLSQLLVRKKQRLDLLVGDRIRMGVPGIVFLTYLTRIRVA